MAQLKSGSTVGGTEIVKIDFSNVSASLPTSVKSTLKGDPGTNGTNGTNGANITYSLSGGNIYITTG